ncbi:MAG: alanine dehydrogenase [Acidobacteriota bacterium]|nr:alanine dehydrogenase [Acidobacteriota bacterium]
MIVGLPKEIKDNENRVALTPAGVRALTAAGHEVVVEQSAGAGSGISDEEYSGAGARILPTADDVFARAEMIVKVKEPVGPEYQRLRPGQILYTYLHLAPARELTSMLLERRVAGVAYETITSPNGSLPLLTPMSEVAGRMAIHVGAFYLQTSNGGRGVLLPGVPGVPPADVVIIGGGVVGTNAAKIAAGMGADVTILEMSPDRMRELDDIFFGRVKTVASNPDTLERGCRRADLLVGAVLIPGAAAPKLVSRELISKMKKGAVAVDVAVDQGGCFATTHATTHSDPVYEVDGVIHYCVANMPGAVARTSTFALTNSTLRYALELANKGLKRAVTENPYLAEGVNTLNGALTYRAVAQAQGRAYTPLKEALG